VAVYILSILYFRKTVGFGFRLLVLCFLPFLGFSQYSHEWIKPGQSYYRIPVAKKGVYRLTTSDLQSAGVPIGSVDPRRIQILHRGVEQAIFVQGQADAVLDPGDYVEFYGVGNDGTLDKDLYKPANLQPHNYYNLYSDTTAYFLTWQLSAVQGKRIANFSEINVTNIPKEDFHQEERLLVLKNEYSGGNKESDVIQSTYFDEGEGWTGTAIRQNQSIDYTLDLITQTVITSGTPQLEILLVGRDAIPHTAIISVGANAGSLRVLDMHNFSGFSTEKLTYTLDWNDIGLDGKLAIRLASPSAANNRFQFSVSYAKVVFPQNFDATGVSSKTINLVSNPTNKSYLELENAAVNIRIWDVTDPTSLVAIGSTQTGSTLKAIVPNTQTVRSLYVFDSFLTPSIKPLSFRFYNPAQAGFVIISHKSLMQPASGYNNPVKAYAGFRASAAGGSYDTLVVTIDQLYNQFNYGETSPRAIYEFMKYLVSEGSPKYLFLIGKGRDVSSAYHRLINPAPSVLKDLVPPAGSPGADMNYTVGLGGTTYEPAVPTGRLSASTSLQVAGYLNKIKEIEMAEAVPSWQKKGLHLSGGIQPNELVTFREYLDGFKKIAEDPYWGGEVSTIAKRDPNPVELINISDEVNAGINLITFFGHSSPSTIDIDIGYVSDPTMGYNNPGKYPAFLINGCNAGNFFAGYTSFGEDWMLTPNKGARNFIAHSSFGFVYSLRYYSDLFYQIGFADSVFVKKGVGDVQKEVARQYMLSAPATMANITQVHQMVLLGDPAVKLFNQGKPDYEVTSTSLSLASFNDKPVTAASDSFAIKIIVKNLGLAVNKPLNVKLDRGLSDGTVRAYDSLFAPVFYMDTLSFTLYKESGGGGENNQFTVTIDPENDLEELNETNNEASINVFIPSNATLNLYPHGYAIVNQPGVKLVWQSTDLIAASRDFIIEVDTTQLFNSPYLINRTVSGKVLANTQINLLSADSTVYYWRTRFKSPVAGESGEWTSSSFAYIIGSPEGWAQIENDQVKENFFSQLIPPGSGTPFTFEETVTSVSVKTFGRDNPSPPTDASIKINGAEYNLSTQGQPCRNNTLNLIAFNKKTAIPYAALPFNFQDPRTCGREPQLINSFTLAELETGLMDDLTAFVNAMSVSDSVVMFSIGNPGYTAWSANVKSKLGELGVSLSVLNDLQAGEPIVIFGRKGATAGTAQVYRSLLVPASEQLITVNGTITGRKTEGLMKSVTIGPASEWKLFKSNVDSPEPDDEFSFSIYGISINGNETLLANAVANDFDLSSISPSEYPYLKIVFETRDEVNLTPVQWKRWAVLYEPMAEGILVWKGPEGPLVVQEGEEWRSNFGFVNISSKNFVVDSLNVDLEILTKESQNRDLHEFLIKAPAVGDTTLFSVTSPTLGKVQTNDVNVFVNKRVAPEPYYDNNFISLQNYLIVEADKKPPVLDVKFDGRTLKNGDYISSAPKILLTMLDENKFRLKKDTAGITLLLKYPCSTSTCSFTRIPLSSNDVTWFPATANSDFRIEYTPQFMNGDYELSAQVADVNGNESGVEPYLISFTVLSEPGLALTSVYPNPSSGNFYFSFLLTGNELPDEFLLEIFNLQGQPIRTFTIDDVQHFNIGVNTVVWDGYEATGAYLPRGVYVYRLRIKAGTIKAATQGKIVVMR
jgi:hypothetical protein